MSTLARTAAATCLALSAACLEPLTSDDIDPSTVFGPTGGDPAVQPHVEDNPELAAKVLQFPRSVAYLKGYADGAKIDYWNVPGPNADFIVPMFIVENAGVRGRPIIDVLPGDAGYSPWWRRVIVRTTARYNGEKIWSREGVDLGVRMGILEAPMPTTEVVDCAVVQRDVEVDIGGGKKAPKAFAWYRNQRVSWVEFPSDISVPTDVRTMPKYPVYVLQRINEPAPIYEFLTGIDLDGDAMLTNSNNIFAANIGGNRYSPLWFVAFVRTVPSYPSIDNTRTGTVGLSAERDFRDGIRVISPAVVGVQEVETALVNCPIQKTRGEF